MNKKEVQKRVSKDGKPLALSKFEWDEKTNTFSSMEDGLVLDFREMHNCTFTTGPNCTFTTGYYCTFDTGFDCTFKTGSNCTFKTGPNCTFDTGSNCTFKTGPNCTFKTGSNCVIVRRDVFEIVQPQKGQVIQLCPHGIEGHLINGELGGVPHIIADGILSRIVKQRGNVWKVANYGETEESWLIKDGDDCAHGETLEDARNSLVYKRKDRDKSAYEGMTEATEYTFADAVKMYRTVTGACAFGVEQFVKQQTETKDKYSVAEILELTKGQFGHDTLAEWVKEQS